KTSPDLADARVGDTVTYTVSAKNVGTEDFPAGGMWSAAIVDDLSGVLDDATFDGTVTVDGSDKAATYQEPQIGWRGPLAAGDTVTLTYQVVLTGEGDGHIDNVTWQQRPGQEVP